MSDETIQQQMNERPVGRESARGKRTEYYADWPSWGEIRKERLNKLQGYRNLLAAAEHEGPNYVRAVQRKLAREDLFFLFVFLLHRTDGNSDWVYQTSKLVQENPDGHLDLWSRGHYKSSLISFGKTIQDILNNPEDTFCIVSYSKTMAEGFLAQIKTEFENNLALQAVFPDVLWTNPQKEASKWSTKDGFSVRRKGNPKEQTVEAFGLVDSQPTGKHFRVLIYDDIVTQDSVTSPEMIEKTTTAWEASMNIGSDSDKYTTRLRYVGTRWHHADTWQAIMDRSAAIPRIFPCTMDGTLRGKPVFLPKEIVLKKYREMKARTFNAQMLLNPTPTEDAPFKREYLRFWDAENTANLNVYIVCDPSARDPNRKIDTADARKKKRGDFTCMWVVGLGADKNIYVLDIVRDRMGQRRRIQTLFQLHAKWQPLKIGYETGSQASDIDEINYQMNANNYRFSLTELPNSIAKADRIENLQGYFEEGRVWLPNNCWKEDYEGNKRDLVQTLIHEELLAYPYGKHDDMLDALSYIIDSRFGAIYPQTGDYRPGYGRDFRQGEYDELNHRGPTDGGYDALNWGLN